MVQLSNVRYKGGSLADDLRAPTTSAIGGARRDGVQVKSMGPVSGRSSLLAKAKMSPWNYGKFF